MAGREVKLPDIGEGVTEGEMVRWLVKVGDLVKADQTVAEVMTDKATVEVPTPVAGTVKELKVKEGDIIPIESTMLVLEVSGTAGSAATVTPAHAQSAHTPLSSAHRRETNNSETKVYPPTAGAHVLATPATRRLAREINVDVNVIAGTGPVGRVTRDDVIKTKTSSKSADAMGGAIVISTTSAGPTEKRVPLRGIRRKIAEQMQMTKRVVPHFTIMDEANVTALVRLRAESKEAAEKYGVKVTYLPFVMKALISSMKEFPMFNASVDDQAGEIVYKKYYNIGFAADTPNGLLVPVIKNADKKTILEISKEIIDLAKKARDGKISLEDMRGATITITNIGSVGGTYATPIINHPEVAIIGMYKLDMKPVYKEGAFVPTQVMNFTVTCDHRLIDGAVAANFLKAFLKRIENVGQLILEMT
ncbi:MAG: hypothetical protein A2Z20_04985 [Bdellovibrionales bacterium RBG_16_40_8]|nr:MAG: hypothetical protein A2Z20_04985 [Bdellovibrionales bacterium RBG_16_40_8]